ncbi:MAG: hypothetical protein KatS3mg105_4941 [Gemmatales bacterium]|nr:MAG: hypothetical protein KatS3mg105_4941 [Gemmatales bacterium]
MLKALELENFKAFGERTRIEFAPITLIFGENSAGKSSILQSLSLLKQTRESREGGALLLPRAETGTVDLGSFQELLFDHDQSRRLAIKLSMRLPSDKDSELRHIRHLFWPSFLPDVPDVLSFEMQLHWPENEREVSLHQLSLGIGEEEKELARFAPVQLKKGDTRRMIGPFFFYGRHPRHPGDPQMRAAACQWVTNDRSIWKPLYEAAARRTAHIVKSIQRLRKDLESPQFLEREGSFLESREEREKFAKAAMEAEEFYSAPLDEDKFLERVTDAEIGNTVLLDGFVPVGPTGLRRPAGRRTMLPEVFATMRYSRGGPLPVTFDVGSVATFAGHAVETVLESMFPMGPFRRPPERWYIFTGSKPQDVGYRGELLPDLLFRSPELVKKTNKWLERLGIGYAIAVRPVGSRASDLFEVRLTDLRRSKDVDVALSDVGFGISQLLPFVVQCLATERQIISIEQPEVHIHPRLQADLGDLLVEAIRKPHYQRFIVETHSEHLVLRLQRLIRERKLQPEDVSVIYVSRGVSGAQAQRLAIDESGDFMDDWPGGFFPERLRELV